MRIIPFDAERCPQPKFANKDVRKRSSPSHIRQSERRNEATNARAGARKKKVFGIMNLIAVFSIFIRLDSAQIIQSVAIHRRQICSGFRVLDFGFWMLDFGC